MMLFLACGILARPTPEPAATATPQPTVTPYPTYTPVACPAVPTPGPDSVEAFYRGMWLTCYMLNELLYYNGLVPLMADCELMVEEALETEQHEIKLPGWRWATPEPPPPADGDELLDDPMEEKRAS